MKKWKDRFIVSVLIKFIVFEFGRLVIDVRCGKFFNVMNVILWVLLGRLLVR